MKLLLQKHSINETPPTEKELLMVIDIGAADGNNLWTVGVWDEGGWCCPFDSVGYNVVEWYELPQRKRIKEDYSYKQMQLEEFWEDK